MSIPAPRVPSSEPNRSANPMEELKKYRGCLGVVLACIVILGAVGLGMFISGNEEPPPALAIGGLVVGIALGIGIWKDARWAKIPSGIILSIAGAGLAIFILVDFVLYLTGGHSVMAGQGGGAFGQAVFILFMTGVALLGAGLALLGVWKISLQ
jgi:hypothetical protein